MEESIELIKNKKGPTKVGDKKWLTTEVTLYKGGLLVTEVYSRCENWFHGLRGRVFIVGRDAKGNSIWVTETYKCKTCGGILDPKTEGEKFDILKEKLKTELAAITKSIDIFHSDEGKNSSSISLKFEKVIAEMKTTFEGKAEIREINNITYNWSYMTNNRNQPNYQSGQFGIGVNYGEIKDGAKVAGIINEAERQNLADAVMEVQQILQQLSQSYPTETVSDKMAIAAEAIKQIEANPTVKQRLISAGTKGGLAFIEKAFDNPIGASFAAAIKGWQEAE